MVDASSLLHGDSVAELQDVTLTSLAAGQLLYSTDGANWANTSNLYWDETNDHLGIGVNPAKRLDISDGSTARFQVDPSSSIVTLYGRNSADTGYVPVVNDATQHIWYNAGTEVARIFTNNNFGIGDDGPAEKLSVKGGNVRFDNRGSGSSQNTDLTFYAGDSAGSWNAFILRYEKSASIDRLVLMPGGTAKHYFDGSLVNFTTDCDIDGDLNVDGDLTLGAFERYTRANDASTGTINALAITSSMTALTGAATTLNGIIEGGTGSETVLYLLNESGGSITINHENGSAIAADRIQTIGSVAKTLANNEIAHFIYVGSRWKLINL